MKIIYTVNGQEGTYSVSGRDKYELQRIMNDGVGIPADPMLDVLVFAAYMGEYSSLYGFYQEIVEEFLDPDELFNSEPIEYFNTVLQPMFEDDIRILDITDWDMMESERRSVKMMGNKRMGSASLRRLREEEEKENSNPGFTAEELQMIADRIWVETQWGEDAYEAEALNTMNSILGKLKKVGFEAR